MTWVAFRWSRQTVLTAGSSMFSVGLCWHCILSSLTFELFSFLSALCCISSVNNLSKLPIWEETEEDGIKKCIFMGMSFKFIFFFFLLPLQEWENSCKWWGADQCPSYLCHRRHSGGQAWADSCGHSGRQIAGAPLVCWLQTQGRSKLKTRLYICVSLSVTTWKLPKKSKTKSLSLRHFNVFYTLN